MSLISIDYGSLPSKKTGSKLVHFNRINGTTTITLDEFEEILSIDIYTTLYGSLDYKVIYAGGNLIGNSSEIGIQSVNGNSFDIKWNSSGDSTAYVSGVLK